MLNFLTRLKQKKSEIESQTSDAWRDLVLNAADDKPINEVATLELLGRLGRTIEDLELAVSVVKKRRAEREQLVEGAKADGALKRIYKDLESASAAFEPIREKYDATVEELSQKRDYWKSVQMRDDQVRESLIRNCTSPTGLGILEAAKVKESSAQTAQKSATDEVTRLNNLRGTCRSQLEHATREDERIKITASLESLNTKYQAAREQLDVAMSDAKSAMNEVMACRQKLVDYDL